MNTDCGWSRAGLTAVVFGVTSWLLAALYVILQSGSGRGDLPAFAFWSGLACVFAVVPLRMFDRWSVRWPSAITLLCAVCAGIVLAAAVTYAAALLLGPWIGAFSFPIFLCWAGGATGAFLLSAVLGNRRRLPFALVLWPVSLVTLRLSLQLATPAAPPEYVVLAPAGASLDQVEAIWGLFSVPPTPTQRDYNPDGIRMVSAFQEGDRAGVWVTFHPGTDAAKRAAVMDRVVASPLVAVVRERDTGKDGRLHERVLKGAKP